MSIRDIFSDLSAPILSDADPVRRAQIQMKQPLPKRFYKDVTASGTPDGFSILLDGRPVQVTLAPQVSNMTESELAEEISLIARLASQNARAGQHLLASGMLQQMGEDPLTARSFVEHELGLPSAETVLADKAQIFATRYTHED